MKWLMKKIGHSAPDAMYYTQLREDLEVLGVVDIFTYKSKFSLFRESNVILRSEPSDMNESNHVELFLNGKKAIQFFKRMWATLGLFSDQNFFPDLNEKIELILLKNGYYTGTTAWKYAPWRPLFILGAIFFYLLVMGVYIFVVLFLRKESLSYYFLIGSAILGLITSVLSYRQYFFSH
jgi:hypothetical protein